MNAIARVGVDLAKQVLQVHAVDASGKVITNRAGARQVCRVVRAASCWLPRRHGGEFGRTFLEPQTDRDGA